MISIVGLFLIGMVALAVMGRLRRPGAGPKARGKCPACGRHRIGKGTCPCGKAG